MSKYSENMPPSLKGAVEWFYDDIKEGSTILDFGCSTGYFGKFLKDAKNCTVYGLEISPDKEEAKKVLDGVYSFDLDGDWSSDVYERKYDALFYGDVLEHLKYPQQALEKSKKLLKQNGKIFISTPNIAHISTRLELLGGNFEYEKMGILDNTHLKYFTLNSFTKIAHAAGYRVVRVDSSTNDYPKEIIEKLLKKYGLTASKDFWDMTKKMEARAFQYKFVLEIGEPKKSELQRPIEKPEQYRDDVLTDLNSQIVAIKAHADAQAKVISHLEKQLSGAQKVIEKNQYQVKNSPVSKVVKKLKKAKKVLNKNQSK